MKFILDFIIGILMGTLSLMILFIFNMTYAFLFNLINGEIALCPPELNIVVLIGIFYFLYIKLKKI